MGERGDQVKQAALNHPLNLIVHRVVPAVGCPMITKPAPAVALCCLELVGLLRVLVSPPPAARIATQETFGPLTCVYSFDALDEAVAASPVGASAASPQPCKT